MNASSAPIFPPSAVPAEAPLAPPADAPSRPSPAAPAAAAGVIGVVTVLYLSDSVLDGFFASLAGQVGVELRLYVIDNSPTPSGTEMARRLADEHGLRAEFVYNNANLGVARGNNQGIERALRDGCRQVLLANNDTEFGPETLATLQAGLARHGQLAATPKILYYGTGGLVWYAGGRIDTWTLRVPHVGMRRPDGPEFDRPGPTFYAPTCFMLVDAGVFRTIGLMDERYFVYYDDVDFVWRMQRASIGLLYLPQSVVEHKVSTSTGGSDSPFSVYYTNRNRIYFIRKHLHGLRRISAVSYFLATRLARSLRLRGGIAATMWRGVSHGWRLPVAEDLPRAP